MQNQFIIVSRNIHEDIKTKVCDNFMDACAEQMAMLVGAPAELVKTMLKESDILQTKENLERYGRDRICNDEEEAYIFLISGRDKMR